MAKARLVPAVPLPPFVLRAVLQHLREHGWQTRDEVQKAVGISRDTFSRILISSCFRVRERKTQGRGRGPREYSLPFEDSRGRWIGVEG